MFLLPAVVGQPDTWRQTWLLAGSPPVRMGEFVIGMCLAFEVRNLRRRLPSPAVLLAIAGIAVVVASEAPPQFSFAAVTLVPFVLVLLSAAQSDLEGRPSFLRNRWLIRLGEVSFAFYLTQVLVQFPLLLFFDHESGNLLADTALAVLCFALSLASAAALQRWVEVPAEARLRAGGPARPNREPDPDRALDLAG